MKQQGQAFCRGVIAHSARTVHKLVRVERERHRYVDMLSGLINVSLFLGTGRTSYGLPFTNTA